MKPEIFVPGNFAPENFVPEISSPEYSSTDISAVLQKIPIENDNKVMRLKCHEIT